MSEGPQKVAEIVKSALECPEPERTAFLDDACGGDADLRAEVDSFLQFQDEASQFIEQGALHVAAQTAAAELPLLRHIDGYEVISRIGVGGMGDVYLARDTKLQRRVALKLVRAEMDSADLVSRFRHEERILASLNHPNIAQLYDAGVANGDIPYFAMEYVEGVRIDEYCKANGLSVRGRLELFRKVCAAVHYAHQRLVIHRDLKPSNILVTDAENARERGGEPKLLDFGIAKLIEGNDALTQLQTLVTGIMTPDYASPEQVRGEAMTTSTDVYSLGVLLYELLTGQRPYRLKTRSPNEIARAITDQEPERPSTAVAKRDGSSKFEIRNSSFPKGDLDNIVLMALRKEPSRRYASVGQFSDDIRRYLEGRPVLAHKDTLRYRAGKFIKRNKAGVVAAALVVAVLAAGIVMTLREKQRAERRFNDVRQLANALLTEIAPKIERLQGSTEARQTLIAQSLKYLDSLAEESGGDAGLQSELATAYEKVAALQGDPTKPNLSDFAGAISSYEKANRIRRNLPNTKENQLLLAENFRGLATVRYAQNDIKGTLRDYAEALRIQESLLPKEPDSYELQAAHLKTKFAMAEVYSYNNQYDVAVPRLRELIVALERLDPNRRETRRSLAMVYAQLGNALSWDGKQPEAEIEMAKATAIADALAAENLNDTDIRHGILKVYALASSIYETINDEISLGFAHKAVRLAEQAVAADTADMRARLNLADMFSRVGILSANLKRFPEAIANLEKSEKVFLDLLARDPANRGYQHYLGILYTRFGDAKQKQSDLQGALHAFQKSADFHEKAFQTDEQNLLDRRNAATALKSAGFVYLELGEKEKAKENFQKALGVLDQLKAQQALGDWDNKMLDEMRAALQSL